jgi:hypothetical protein
MSDMKASRSMAVLGTTGYIGRSLSAAAREHGFEVTHDMDMLMTAMVNETQRPVSF